MISRPSYQSKSIAQNAGRATSETFKDIQKLGGKDTHTK